MDIDETRPKNRTMRVYQNPAWLTYISDEASEGYAEDKRYRQERDPSSWTTPPWLKRIKWKVLGYLKGLKEAITGQSSIRR